MSAHEYAMNALTIDIRQADPLDADGIACVHAVAWHNAYAGIIPHRALRDMIARRNAGWWARAIRRGTSVLVVDMGGQIVGYATYGLNRARSLPQDGEIYEIYLRPEYQGVGLGGRLFKAAQRQLARHGCDGFVVWALEENAQANGFYSHYGGKDIAEGQEVFDGKVVRKTAFVWN